MLIVVVKYMNMSQCVDQMELRTLTPVWLAVLIVVILARGWVYFINSSFVVNSMSCDKDVIEFICNHDDFNLPFQEAPNNLQSTSDKHLVERKLCIAIVFLLGMTGAFECGDLVPYQPSLLYIPCQLSETW